MTIPVFRTVFFVPMAFSMVLVASGCAFQSDVTDLHLEMDQLKDKLAQMTLKQEVQDRSFKDKTVTSSREQGDIFVKVDQMGVDLQTIQGRIEVNNHAISELTQKSEEHGLRINDVASRMGGLESRLAQNEKLMKEQGPGPSAAPGQGAADSGKILIPGTPPPAGSLTPQDAYNLSYNDFVKGNFDLAIAGFQNFVQQYPGSVLTPMAYYWLGESYFGKKDFPKAAENFDKVSRDFPKHEKVPSSILKLGYAYLEMGQKGRAKIYLKKVIEQYPRSNEANLAKEKLADLR